MLEEDNLTEGTCISTLTKLAAKCTAKRMVPDYISEKIMMESKVDKNGEGHLLYLHGAPKLPDPVCGSGDGKSENITADLIRGVDNQPGGSGPMSSEGDFDKFWKLFDERLELPP